MLATVGAALRLARPSTTALSFLAIFLPLLGRTHDLLHSLLVASPLLFVTSCTFILNDIDDLDRDVINHPDRPLPSGRIVPRLATAIYFVGLALAALTTKAFVPKESSFFYYALMLLVINYGYVVDHFTSLKPFYVAFASAFPALIVFDLAQQERGLLLVALATFLFVAGRELLLDFLDRTGDAVSAFSQIPEKAILSLAFAMQAIGILSLLPLVRSIHDACALAMIAFTLPLAYHLWRSGESAKVAILAMKFQLFGGVYFLF